MIVDVFSRYVCYFLTKAKKKQKYLFFICDMISIDITSSTRKAVLIYCIFLLPQI